MTTAYSGALSASDPRGPAPDADPAAPEEDGPVDDFDAAYAGFEESVPDPDAVETDTSPTDITPPDTETGPAVPVSRPKPDNPWAGKVKPLSSTWGTSVHERSYFAPTTKTDYHGVWGTKKLSEVRSWVSTARDSIDADDDFVVASRPAADGGYDFLVGMNGTRVGYLSGGKVAPGTMPEASYVAVHVNRKGYVDTAFPCTPEVF